jgi:hypothetical protein
MKSKLLLINYVLLALLGLGHSVFGQTAAQIYTETAPAKSNSVLRDKTRYGAFIHPLATLLSGLEMGIDIKKKNHIDVTAILGYYANQSSFWYNGSTGNSSSSSGYFSGDLTDINGFKGEFQVKKDIPNELMTRDAIAIGIFAQYRTVSATFNGSYNSYISSTSSYINVNYTNKKFTAASIFAGPVISYYHAFTTSLYFQTTAGVGFCIPLGDGLSQKLFDIRNVNPYVNSFAPKINFAFGFYLD